MFESNATFLEYEAAYRAERMRGLSAPRRAERRRPATAGLLRRATRTAPHHVR